MVSYSSNRHDGKLSTIFPFFVTSAIFVLVSFIFGDEDADNYHDQDKRSKNALTGDLNSSIVSYSSCLIASSRAIESERPDALIVDPLAKFLASTAYEYRKKHTEKPTWRIAIRTRYFDDHIRSFLTKHNVLQQQQQQEQTVQVVHLGVGMDSRAYRLEEANENTIFYEIDCPEVLELKERLLTDLRKQLLLSSSSSSNGPSTDEETITEGKMVISIPRLREMIRNGDSRRRTLSCNLEESGWEEHLLRTGFDVSRPTCWVLEGLTYYLKDDGVVSSIFQTMRRMSAEGSSLIVSISSKHGVKRAKRSKNKLMQSWKWGTDEPIKFLSSSESGGWECTSDDVVILGEERANYGRYPQQNGNAEHGNGHRSEISYVTARC